MVSGFLRTTSVEGLWETESGEHGTEGIVQVQVGQRGVRVLEVRGASKRGVGCTRAFVPLSPSLSTPLLSLHGSVHATHRGP